MAVIRGKSNPRIVDCCSVGCNGEMLDAKIKELNADGWNIRQIFQEPPSYYRIFAQREADHTPAGGDREAEGIQFIKDNPEMSIRDTFAELQARGIRRSRTWVADKRFELCGEGVR